MKQKSLMKRLAELCQKLDGEDAEAVNDAMVEIMVLRNMRKKAVVSLMQCVSSHRRVENAFRALEGRELMEALKERCESDDIVE